MANLNVPLPLNMKDYVDAQVEAGDYVDGADYVRALIRRDHDQRIQALRDIVEESRASGVSNRTLDEIFAEAVANTKARGTYRE